jgi:hypothetical protein
MMLREIKSSKKRKSTVFWDMSLCSMVKVNRHFAGIYHLHHHQVSCCYFAQLIWSWRQRRYVPSKRWLTINGLHGVISQKIELFISIAVGTSNPTSKRLIKTRLVHYIILLIKKHWIKKNPSYICNHNTSHLVTERTTELSTLLH